MIACRLCKHFWVGWQPLCPEDGCPDSRRVFFCYAQPLRVYVDPVTGKSYAEWHRCTERNENGNCELFEKLNPEDVWNTNHRSDETLRAIAQWEREAGEHEPRPPFQPPSYQPAHGLFANRIGIPMRNME